MICIKRMLTIVTKLKECNLDFILILQPKIFEFGWFVSEEIFIKIFASCTLTSESKMIELHLKKLSAIYITSTLSIAMSLKHLSQFIFCFRLNFYVMKQHFCYVYLLVIIHFSMFILFVSILFLKN